jgi:hypothetical protein
MKRGENLKGPDGAKGRSMGGRARVRKLARVPVDDSGRSHAQYWGQLGWVKMMDELGPDGARAEMSRRGQASWNGEMREYSRYLGEMRRAAK